MYPLNKIELKHEELNRSFVTSWYIFYKNTLKLWTKLYIATEQFFEKRMEKGEL